MLVLVVNAGSSTLKCQLIQTEGKTCLMKSLAERIGEDKATMEVAFIDGAGGKTKVNRDIPGMDISGAFECLLEEMTSNAASPISALSEIEAVGNRIVSGGEYFSHSELVDDDVLAKIVKCGELAPLHNPNAAACIEFVRAKMPETPQVAVFDTAFHLTMPTKAYLYPLPYRYYTDYHVRRYGAHGTSHRYAARRAAEMLGNSVDDMGVITCHLGSGGSITAVWNGESVDTTMGFTPLDGLMMGTRCGSIDPAIVPYIMRCEGISADEMENVMNRQSGVLGIAGETSDMREVQEAAESGDELADTAIQMYVYRVLKAIGSYYAVMPRTDAVVMTAGIGENSVELRELIFEGLQHLGMIVDPEKNRNVKAMGGDCVISADDSPVKICVVAADEEMCIAFDTCTLASGGSLE